MVQKSPVSGAGLLPCLVICRSTSILRGTVRLLVLNRNNRRRNLSASVCVVFFFFFFSLVCWFFWGAGFFTRLVWLFWVLFSWTVQARIDLPLAKEDLLYLHLPKYPSVNLGLRRKVLNFDALVNTSVEAMMWRPFIFSCIIACTGGSVLFVCLFLLCLLLCYIVTILYFYSFNTKSSSSSGENLQPH